MISRQPQGETLETSQLGMVWLTSLKRCIRACYFINHERRKTTTVYKQRAKQIIRNEYKGRFYRSYLFSTSIKNTENVRNVINKTEEMVGDLF